MMGNDCERILSGINKIKNELQNALEKLSNVALIPIEMEPYTINHVDGTVEIIYLIEKKINVSNNILSEVEISLSNLSSDFIKMESLRDNLYTDSLSFNNSNGSPWTEFTQLKSAIDKIKSLIIGGINYTSQIFVIISFINSAISCAVDAKLSLTIYHDYIQRGYDAIYNDKKPSVQFTSGYDRKTIGNIKQDYSENVNIEKENIDPF